jgi:hypothetical protein
MTPVSADASCTPIEHEVPGLGESQRETDRLEVAHLADQDDVGVLAEAAAQRVGEGLGVLADLALVHRGLLVLVDVFDRVFDGDDVHGAVGVDPVDHRGKCRRLARPRRAGHEHQALLQLGEATHHFRRAEIFEGWDVPGDHSQGHGRCALLAERVPADARTLAPREREVDVPLRECLPLRVVQETFGHR